MKVYVAEKREVSQSIVKAMNQPLQEKKGYFELSNGDAVTWASGHMLETTDPEDHDPRLATWTLESLPLKWPVKLKRNPKTSAQLTIILELMKKSSEIINACDVDSSGQRIFDAIIEYGRIPSQKKITRALINDNNPDKILRELERRRDNTDFLGLSQVDLARSVADKRFGYTLTRLLSVQARKQGASLKLVVGRVQSCLLGLVIRRERLRSSHVTSYYQIINGTFRTSVGDLSARLEPIEEYGLSLDDKGRFCVEMETQYLASELSRGDPTLNEIVRKRHTDSPPLPFDLLSLQSEANRLFNLSPTEVMEITQQLRMEPFFAITYNRCDTRFLSDDQFSESPEVIDNLATVIDYQPIFKAGLVDKSIKSRAFNSAKITAHTAMMPTGNVSGYPKMNAKQQAIYTLIVRNFLMQFMEKREREVTEYKISVVHPITNELYIFKGKTTRILRHGWQVMLGGDIESEDIQDNEGVDTAFLMEQDKLTSTLIESVSQKTAPPASYTMDTLLKDCSSTAKYVTDPVLKAYLLEKDKDKDGESGGIGTSATRDTIIEKLFTNQFLTKQSSGAKNAREKIIPTEQGYLIYDLLPESVVSPDTTAIWANDQSKVQTFEMSCDEFWSRVDEFIANEVARVKRDGLKIPEKMINDNPAGANRSAREEKACPKCGSAIPRLKGKYGFFWPCKACDTVFKDHNKAPYFASCQQCGAEMKLIHPKDKKKKTFSVCSQECGHKEWP
jgi:DNA topoisomerase-3